MTLLFLLCLLFQFNFIVSLSCINENGSKVAWWVAFKYPGGASYLYADVDNATLRVSMYQMDSNNEGALARTLLPLYRNQDTFGRIFYNDDYPVGAGEASSVVGHTKGVLGMDMEGGFSLVHSTPKFPPVVKGVGSYAGIPASQQIFGQSFLCVSVDSSNLDLIGQQLQYSRPGIYDSKTIANMPKSLIDLVNGAFIRTPSLSEKSVVLINGEIFQSYEKSSKWGRPLYQHIANSTKLTLLVESWIRGSKIESTCEVKNIEILNFPGLSFRQTRDHSKWVISYNTDSSKICIGGINQMTSQNSRGGGTTCFDNPRLWDSLRKMVVQYEEIEDIVCPSLISTTTSTSIVTTDWLPNNLTQTTNINPVVINNSDVAGFNYIYELIGGVIGFFILCGISIFFITRCRKVNSALASNHIEMESASA